MARKKEKKLTPARPQLGDNVEILAAGEVLEGMAVRRPGRKTPPQRATWMPRLPQSQPGPGPAVAA